MPWYKRKPVDFLPPPESQDETAPAWYIPESGEIFLNYEEYLARMAFYKTRLFSCECTGRLNLTFFEAIQSELRAKQEVEERFPSLWTKPALEIIHYCNAGRSLSPSYDFDFEPFLVTKSQNELIDALHDYFRKTVFLDEIIFLDVPAAGNERTVQRARILSRCSIDDVPELSQKEGVRSLLKPPVHSERLQAELSISHQNNELAEAEKEAFKVELLSQSKRQFYAGFSQIRRDRLALSKQTFKRFIREMAVKDGWIGGVWQAKPEIVQKYGLRTSPPEEVLALAASLAQKKKGKRKDYAFGMDEGDGLPKKRGRKLLKDAPLQFPIEDTQLFQPSLIRQPREGEPRLSRPQLTFDFAGIGPDHVLALLQTWSFLVTYSNPLQLFPFTLDDFTAALKHPSDSAPYPDLIIETFGSLIKFACRDWAEGLTASTTGAHAAQVPLASLASFPPEQHNTIAYVVTKTYEGLKHDDRIAMDQWYRWQPDRYSQKGKKKKSISHIPSSERYRAWAVALAGLVKDRLPGDGPLGQLKWRVLACLLSRESESDAEAAEKKRMEAANGNVPPNDKESSPLTELDDSGDTQDAERDEEDEDDEDELISDSRRSSRRKAVRYFVEDEEEDYTPNEHSMSTRNRSLPKTTSSHARSGTSSSKTTRLSNSTTKKITAPSKNELAFGEFCDHSEQGFWNIAPLDRLFLLRFLIEDCLADNATIRAYHEECHEQILDLKREKRELNRDRRQLRLEMDEIECVIRELYPDAEYLLNGERRDSIPMDISTSHMTDASTTGSGHFDETIPEEDLHLTRVERLKREQARKVAVEAKRKEEMDKQKEEKKRFDELKKLEDLERANLRRENVIDYQLRMLSAAERYRPLGRDRFFNRYWWFDAGIGAYPFELINQDIDRQVKTKSKVGSEAGPLVWASGCLFVEDFGLDKFHSSQVEAIQLGMVDGKWGHYSTPEDIDRLINWLDERGIRELALRSTIEKLQVFIKGGMEKRIEQLNNDFMLDNQQLYGSRIYLQYSNKWANS